MMALAPFAPSESMAALHGLFLTCAVYWGWPDMKPLYKHPDGFSVHHTDGVLVIIDDTGLEIHMPIGPLGLADIGADLIALAAEVGEDCYGK